MKEYKGYEYEITFCDPDRGWESLAGLFHISSQVPIGGNNYSETYKKAKDIAEKSIDEWIASLPKTKDEWLDSLERCIVGEGELNRKMAWDLLVKASKHLIVK